MAIVLPPQQNWQNALGQGLGSGIQTGVTSLIEQKLQQMAQEQQANQRMKSLEGLSKSGLLGDQSKLTPEILQQLKYADPTTLNTIIKQQLQAPQNEAYAKALQGILGGEGTEVPVGGINQQQAGELANLSLKKQKMISESQKEVKPFLDAHYQDVKNAKLIKSKAENMLKILDQHENKFPTNPISANRPEILFSDPDIRKYIADANNIVTLLAGSRKGTPTNFKIRLEQLSKPSVNQPIETQRNLLKDLIASSDDVFATTKRLDQIKKENKGLYPADLTDRLVMMEGQPKQQTQANIKPGESVSSVPIDQRPIGAQAKNKKTGEMYFWDGQEWVTEKEFKAKGAQNAGE